IAMMGMVVLVVDVGGVLNLRRRLVLAADSAALAAAQSCALNDAASAPIQADSLATANQPDAVQTNYETFDCGTAASGSVRVAYEADKQLVFAPVLGAGDNATVPGRATAIWGPTGGINPMPIEFSVNPNGQVPCAFQDIGTVCAYWHDNSEDQNLNNSSNWGFMNLESAGVAADASCPNSGASDRADYINEADRAPIHIGEDGYTLVCVDSGHAGSNWYDALLAQIGEVKYFPVNDPQRMVRVSGKEKYAIIGFVALRVDDVLKGNDPAAIGTPGASGHCSLTQNFTQGMELDLDTLGCATDALANLRLSRGNGRNETVFNNPGHYTFDSSTNVLRWFAAGENNVTVEWDWATAGTAGKCGSHSPDPNAVCLVTSWQGLHVGGSLPGNGQDFGLRAVRLSE
ncbi:MAG: pilus assembly protein TadG-related protein, partial [Actinomycetota bacterium]